VPPVVEPTQPEVSTGTTTTIPEESTTTTLPEKTSPETKPASTTIPKKDATSPSTTYPDTTNVVDVLDKLPNNATTEDVAEIIEDIDFAKVADKDLDAVIDSVFGDLTDNADVAEVLETFLDAKLTDEQLEAVLDKAFEDISDAEQVTGVLVSLLSADLDEEKLETVVDAVFNEDASVSEVGAVVDELLDADLSGEELAVVFDAVFDDDLSDSETIELAQEILKGELDSEEFGTVVNAIFDEVVTDEVLIETFTAVLETELDAKKFEAVVNVLESEVISNEQVSEVVTLIIQQEGGIDSGQATELATSEKVLTSIDGQQATEVFDAVIASAVSSDDGLAIVGAVQEAPLEVKEAFEEELNVFVGVFDTYVALGSTIDIGTRRSVIAVNLVASTVAIASATGVIPSPGSNSNTPSPRQDIAARKEEEEPEEGGAIEGEGPDWIKSISIYKYEDGVKTMDWKKFTQKFIYGVMGSAFTLAGATVMYFTLSGLTQQIALWGTLIAFACAMYLHMKEPEE